MTNDAVAIDGDANGLSLTSSYIISFGRDSSFCDMACCHYTYMVGEEGLEPSRPCGQQILSLPRMPFRHSPKTEVPESGYFSTGTVLKQVYKL